LLAITEQNTNRTAARFAATFKPLSGDPPSAVTPGLPFRLFRFMYAGGMASVLERTITPPTGAVSLGAMAEALKHSAPVAMEFDDGSRAELPQEIAEAFAHIVKTLAGGRAVTVGEIDETLSTGEAAEILQVSRPTMVKYLDEGRIPFLRPAGTHRRVKLADVIAFQAQLRAERKRILDEMTREATADGLRADGFVATR
jgi:excisionase family DNA binding protein